MALIALAVLGVGLIVAGVAWVFPPAGLVVLGAVFVFVAYKVAEEGR